MIKLIPLISLLILAISLTPSPREKKEPNNKKEQSSKIRLIFNDTVLTATMYDNPTTRDFLSRLPLTLKMEDYAGKEKVSYLPEKLSLKDAPAGSAPSIGDITYYAPWGNLAIFYRDFSYSRGLIKLGRIDSDANYLGNWIEPKTVRIEKIIE